MRMLLLIAVEMVDVDAAERVVKDLLEDSMTRTRNLGPGACCVRIGEQTYEELATSGLAAIHAGLHAANQGNNGGRRKN